VGGAQARHARARDDYLRLRQCRLLRDSSRPLPRLMIGARSRTSVKYFTPLRRIERVRIPRSGFRDAGSRLIRPDGGYRDAGHEPRASSTIEPRSRSCTWVGGVGRSVSYACDVAGDGSERHCAASSTARRPPGRPCF